MASAARSRALSISSTALFVCDVQERFRNVILDGAALIRACNFLMRTFGVVKAQTYVTEQYPKALGKTVAELLPLAASATVWEKTAFSMCNDDLVGQLSSKGINTVALCGLETHVCVLQTAQDLARAGFAVHVVVDAVSSQRALDRTLALQRLQTTPNVVLTTCETLAFELLGDSKHEKFKEVSALVKERNTWHATAATWPSVAAGDISGGARHDTAIGKPLGEGTLSGL